MRLKRYELVILCITALFLAFTGGYFLGRNTVHASITTSTDVQLETNSEPQTEPVVETDVQQEPKPDETGSETAGPGEPVNLNTATEEQLQELNEIGPVLAERIVAYRNDCGGFQTKEQIMEVPGIGEGIYAKIENDITVE